ncbi:hypothetical protein HCN44_007251 [Aphidius gifuensis]|uniref:Amino acid transporter transmembrane domain-containing protein n=1 Tax=Aphidius gifuensis TaxID=684658 RepID=A0A834XMY6_APHGI|nr:hypothetical protein HCN44_007251 [Aphidius gifuensis]
MGPDIPLTQKKNHDKTQHIKNGIFPSKDVENDDNFNPFAERVVENPTTDGDTLTHLLKASLGTGILQMPSAFRCLGWGMGLTMTLVVAFVCTYCAYILVKSAHVLYFKTKKTSMSFGDVAQTALETGPAPFRKYGLLLRWIIDICLFIAYFLTCSAYAYIIAKNIKEICNGLQYSASFSENFNIYLLAILLVPIIIFSYIPDLKYLAPFSMMANVLMGIALIAIFGWLGGGLIKNGIHSRVQFIGNIQLLPNETNSTAFNSTNSPIIYKESSWILELPKFLYITIFAIEAIGVIMPLENKMKTPQNFVGPLGVLSKGMGIVTMIYIALGLTGYLWDPTVTSDLVTSDIKIEIIDLSNLMTFVAYIVRSSVALAVFFTFTLQFFVCLETAWRCVKLILPKAGTKENYILRTILVIAAVIIPMGVKQLGALVGLIGAVCFSILGLLVPAIIESATYWKGDKHRVLRTIKNVIIAIVSILVLIFGSIEAIKEFSK